jgi:hypothetical protein
MEITLYDALQAQRLNHSIAHLLSEHNPFADELAFEAIVRRNMYGFRIAMSFLDTQSACWMMLASLRLRSSDDDLELDIS